MQISVYYYSLLIANSIGVSALIVNSSPPSSQIQFKNNQLSLKNRVIDNNDRRSFLRKISSTGIVVGPLSLITSVCLPETARAESSTSSYLKELESSYDILLKVPDLLRDQKWDEVRTLLKSPPVNYLWNMGENQNTLTKTAKETGNFDLIEIKDELSVAIQMCDQLTYDNVFIYYQPGNGKVNIKEPVILAERAIKQLAEAINMVKSE